MKKIWLLLLVCALGLRIPLFESESVQREISSREDLERIADDPSGRYVLTADIDLGDAAWTPIPFSGSLDGAGHTIGNLTVNAPGTDTALTYDGNDKTYDTVLAGLFSVVRSAEIKNLRILNANVSVETDQNCFLGSIAGYASDSVFTGCVVETRQSLLLTSVNAGLGGLVGFSENCTFDACDVDAELVFKDTNKDVFCEEFLGGVFSCGYGSVNASSVRLRGFAEIYGYAHNGGVIGMFKLAPGMRRITSFVQDTTVDVEISFFEITRSRRAYCKPIIGEDAYELCRLKRNQEIHYERRESREAIPERPEPCEVPAYSLVLTEPTCTEWGYTTYTCNGCGYTYRDAFQMPHHMYRTQTVPATCMENGYTEYTCSVCGDTYKETIPLSGHTPGAWVTVQAPSLTYEGTEELRCSVCGEVLEERPIPKLVAIPIERVRVAESTITLSVGESTVLSVLIDPADATDVAVRYRSDDPLVAEIDETGRITAVGEGSAVITVCSADGNVQASCTVVVRNPAKRNAFFSWLRCSPDD